MGANIVRNVENVYRTQLNDTIIGDASNNLISGNGGNDVLTGGGGSDTFEFAGGTSYSRITDFQASGVDHDFLTIYDANNQVRSFADIVGDSTHTAHATQVGNDTVITFGYNNQVSIVLEHVAISSLNANDFHFA